MANFIVTNTNDSGAGSLRQAVIDANTLAGADTINFNIASGSTITLSTGELLITDSVVIDGDLNNNGTPDIAVSGNNASRVFNLNDGNASVFSNITLDGLIITGGLVAGDGGGINTQENLTITNTTISGNTTTSYGDGAAIYSRGGNGTTKLTISITNSTISGNSADDGGGIYLNDNGTILNISDSTISGNTAGDDGGGIYSDDIDNTLTINNTTISGNSARNDGGGINNDDRSLLNLNNSTISGNIANDDGGAIYNDSRATANITNSTISGNIARTGDGGGIYNFGSTATLNLTNSTISGNSAGDDGGGIFVNASATAIIKNSTISGNSAGDDGGGIFVSSSSTAIINNSTISGNSAGDGGGIYNRSYTSYYGNTYSGKATITSTIIAKNVGDKDISGGFTTGGNNLIGNGDGGTGFTNNVNGDKVGTTIAPIDPLLGALQNNGGKTFTQALLAGSPAIDAGSNPDSLLNDQRGVGFARSVGQIDIGAFEVQPPTGTTLFAPFSFSETVSGSFTSTVGAFTSTSNTGGGSLFQGTVSINSLTGVQNGVTFTSAFNTGNFLGIGTGTTGIIV